MAVVALLRACVEKGGTTGVSDREEMETRHKTSSPLRRLCWARLEPEKPQAGATSSIVREKERKREKREKRETQASSILYVNIYREYYNAA